MTVFEGDFCGAPRSQCRERVDLVSVDDGGAIERGEEPGREELRPVAHAARTEEFLVAFAAYGGVVAIGHNLDDLVELNHFSGRAVVEGKGFGGAVEVGKAIWRGKASEGAVELLVGDGFGVR